ncbi:formyltransferase family protein [Thalassospiraceae bacterium LMO-JJ14]|nr:formyltransferase family protein [Thalassospiraceae bacterium LMO-JJ14]
MTRTLNIALLGERADMQIGNFPGDKVRVILDHSEIREDDDLVFCLAYARLIPEEFLNRPRYGVFVTHSTDLPQGRGWAPLQWSVLKGLDHITITAFKAEPGCDSGPWCFKERFPISQTDTIKTLYTRDTEVTAGLLAKIAAACRDNTLVLYPQEGEASHWRRRTPEDSELDSRRPLIELWDHIRVCDNDHYPAFFRIDGSNIILRYEVVAEAPPADSDI